jgi:predicted nuclease of restriction endonuclease-like (RecB) superfamily
MPAVPLPTDYAPFLERLKQRIAQAQVRAALAVSRELIELYWQIGRDIVTEQGRYGWGDGVLERVAADLKVAFPGVEGFSRRNLYRMRAFYLAYPRDEHGEGADQVVPQAVAQIPWGHNALLLEKVKDTNARLWYAAQTAEQGWGRVVLEHQIASGLYERQGRALTNFALTLPPLQSDLAQQVLKDPYNFDLRGHACMT